MKHSVLPSDEVAVDQQLWRQVAACIICGTSNVAEVMRARDPHYGVPGIFPIYHCDSCDFHFLNPQPTSAYLRDAYPAEYYSYKLTLAPKGWRKLLKNVKQVLRHILVFHAFQTRDPYFKRPGIMLDIGCGAGDFLVAMRDRGWVVYGVEINQAAAETGRTAGNLDIWNGDLVAANLPSNRFNYIRLNHSFEHIVNPREVLKEIKRIIKVDGKLFIGVPNIDSLAARLFGGCWYYLGPPTHPFGYSTLALTKLLAYEGFVVEKVRYSANYAGIVGSIQIWANRSSAERSDRGWYINNPILKLVGQWIAEVTNLLHRGDCIEVIARPVDVD